MTRTRLQSTFLPAARPVVGRSQALKSPRLPLIPVRRVKASVPSCYRGPSICDSAFLVVSRVIGYLNEKPLAINTSRPPYIFPNKHNNTFVTTPAYTYKTTLILSLEIFFGLRITTRWISRSLAVISSTSSATPSNSATLSHLHSRDLRSRVLYQKSEH